MADNENKKSELQQTIKKVLKRITKIFAKKSMILVLIIVCIVILLSSFIWFSFNDWGVWRANEKGRPSIYTGSVKIDPEKGIVIDKKEMIKQALMDMGYTEEEIEKMSEQQIRIFIKSRTYHTIPIFRLNTRPSQKWNYKIL